MSEAIDRATFRALQEAAGESFVAELVETFLDEAPKMLDALRGALAAGDEPLFRRTAHSLKSNGLTFGAVTLGNLARDLETGAHDAVAGADARVLDALIAEEARAAAALRELIHG